MSDQPLELRQFAINKLAIIDKTRAQLEGQRALLEEILRKFYTQPIHCDENIPSS